MAEDFLEEQQPVDIQKYWLMAQRRRWYFLVPFFLGWLAVWGYSWFMPSVYRSETVILVEQPSVSRELVPSTAASDLQDRLDSIQPQIRSRTRLLQVIHKLNLYPKQTARHVSDDALIDQMNKDLEIELGRAPGKEALSSFNIYFSADNPYTAQMVTAELSNNLISETLDVGMQNSNNVNQFFDSQLEEARKTLADQDEKVREFKDRYPGELPTQTQTNLQILSGLQAQLQAEEDGLGRDKTQNTYLQSMVSQYRSVTPVARPGQPDPTGLPAIDAALDRLRSQLADLLARYTDQYPDVRKVREQITRTEKLRAQTVAAMKAAPATDGSASDTTPESGPLMEVESQLKANQIEIANRQRAIAEVQARINDYQARLNRAPTREQELADLTRDYNQSQANYDSLLAKRNQSQLASSLNKTQEGEHFRMIDPPSLPTKPFSPDRFKMSLIALGVGFALGGVVMVGSEFVDDRMYGDEEFKKLLAVDVLGEIPPLPTMEEENGRHRSFMVESAVASGIALITLAGIAFSFLRG